MRAINKTNLVFIVLVYILVRERTQQLSLHARLFPLYFRPPFSGQLFRGG